MSEVFAACNQCLYRDVEMLSHILHFLNSQKSFQALSFPLLVTIWGKIAHRCHKGSDLSKDPGLKRQCDVFIESKPKLHLNVVGNRIQFKTENK